MLHLFRRRRHSVDLRVRSRSESAHSARPAHVRIDRLAPQPDRLVGWLAYVQLKVVQTLTGRLDEIDDVDRRARVVALAGRLVERLQGFEDQLPGPGDDGVRWDAVAVGREVVDAYWARLTSREWYEDALTALIVSGLVDDFGLRLVRSLKGQQRSALSAVLTDRSVVPELVDVLQGVVAERPETRDRMALWGRRLVADTLLLCRDQLALDPEVLGVLQGRVHEPGDAAAETVAQIEAVHADLLAEHSRRMDLLGLAA